MSRYRFVLRPRWLLSHLLIALLVVVMINLGFWQLRRLDERKADNAKIESNEKRPVAPLPSVVAPSDPPSIGDTAGYRPVTVTGTYDTGNEVIIRARTQDGRPGVWVATPLREDSGAAVLVARGFLPTQGTLQAVPADAEPPRGDVTVEGLVQATQTRGSYGATDPSEGRLTDMARVDVERVARQLPYGLYPVWVQLQTQDPAQIGREPEALPAPVLDEGPHLSYAVQWFIFSTIAIVGYPLILRRKARKGDETPAGDDDDQAASRLPEMSPAG